MNDQFETKNVTGDQVIKECFEAHGGGVNTSIPITVRPFPPLTKKQIIRDSEIVKELCYLCDVMNNKDRAVELFFDNRNRLSDPCFWEVLRTMWIANGKMEMLLTFRRLFESKRPFKQYLMTIEEEAAFKDMPDPVTAFRAPGKVGDPGISWTLSRQVVERFARSYGRSIVERSFPKSRIVAYFNRRNEQEIVVL